MHNGDLNNKVDVSALPCSQACENNKQPILEVLQIELQDSHHVLEIGSGTGQHSVHFAPHLSHLKWQTSDVISNHRHIMAWHQAYPTPNLYAPLAFDLSTDAIPVDSNSNSNSQSDLPYDAVFTANTLHIISWDLVRRLFALAGDALPANGKLIVYGPFNEDGNYTSEGNQRFDAMLRAGNPYAMPANNQLLVFQKI